MGLDGQRAAVWLVAVLSLVSWPAGAQERYGRDWSDYPGMPRSVADLTFDDNGFLWLVGVEGVHRFDGHQVVQLSPRPGDMLVGINRGPDARMVAWTEQGLLFDVAPRGLVRVTGPGFEGVRDADYDGRGVLWVADEGGLYRRDLDDAWTRVDTPDLDGQMPMRVRGAPGGGAVVGTWQGRLLRVRGDGSTETWFENPTGRITRIAMKDDRTQAFTLRFGPAHGIYVAEGGRVRPVLVSEPDDRFRWTGLVYRGDTLWAMSTVAAFALHHGERSIERLGRAEGFEPGGELVMDQENSLWVTSFRGLYQFTDPDVILWHDTDGSRGVHTTAGEVVLGSWAGAQRLTADGTRETLVAEDHHTFDWGGMSPWGTYWFVAVKHPHTNRARSALLEFHERGWTSWLENDWGVFSGAYARQDGVFWLIYFNSLWRVDGKGEAPREVADLGTDKALIPALCVDGRHVSWASRYESLYCEGRLDETGSSLQDGWDCETIAGAGEIIDLVRFEGEPWIATWNRGLMRRHDGRWETVLDATVLGSDTIRGIEPSPRGGLWVTTFLERARFEMREGEPHVVERLGPWMGVPDWRNFDVFEQPDGSIWLSGFSSVAWIPARARDRAVDPPRVFVTGFRADGRELESDEAQVLPATTDRIELSWSAAAFLDPASLRFQVRADSRGDWVPTIERSFRFVGLGPGEYRIEVRASLDGRTWSDFPADIRFAIRSPFWQRPTFWGAVLALCAMVALLVQWQRSRQQVRLERQRTDIAMNLHDELGAGLGSIGLLADLAAEPSLDADERRDVAVRVGEISRGLSRALSDIVWTLRPQSVDLPGFALYLRQRAGDLFAAGDTMVEFAFPDPVPPVRIQLAVRRQIHAIASEALHNTARHADATRVRVALRADGAAWILAIEDDGVGLDPGARPPGLGLESMKRRAESIGARLSIGHGRDGGCRVELRFTPRAEEDS